MFYYATEIHSYVFDNENKSLYEMPQKVCYVIYMVWSKFTIKILQNLAKR